MFQQALFFSSKDISLEQLRELDREVRWMALQKFSQLEDKNSYLTLNISTAWIDYISNAKHLPTLDMLDELNIDRSRIIIEITEGTVKIDKLKAVVNTYRQHGLKVAIDDYGSGYSQLARVIAINPDIIKIDIGLFQLAVKGGIAGDAMHLLTRFGKRLGCQIICEGIEKMDQFFIWSGVRRTIYARLFIFTGASRIPAIRNLSATYQFIKNKIFFQKTSCRTEES